MAGVYERDGEWWPVPRPVPLARVVRGALLNALAYTDGRQKPAAALLGLSQRALSYHLRQYGIPTDGTPGRRLGRAGRPPHSVVLFQAASTRRRALRRVAGMLGLAVGLLEASCASISPMPPRFVAVADQRSTYCRIQVIRDTRSAACWVAFQCGRQPVSVLATTPDVCVP